MQATDRQTLLDLLGLPTAPFNEQHVIAHVRAWLEGHPGIEATQDEYGNQLLRLRRGRPVRQPLVFVAHMDHPGFESDRMLGRKRLRAFWRGWVAPEYFPKARVRFFVEGDWVRGAVQSVTTYVDRGRRRVRDAMITVDAEVPPGSLGMWDFPDPVIRGERVYARGCDDVAGVAGVLCALDRLLRMRGNLDVYALLTRAEEVGFAGAMAACRARTLPEDARVISVETSSEIPGVYMGQGPILRVGDASAVFDHALTALCRNVATRLMKRDPKFRIQRRLMDGGTCEASAFQAFGYRATGICVALGNYHNMNRRRRVLGPEYIHLHDFDTMVRWFTALAMEPASEEEVEQELRGALARIERKWTPLLVRTTARATGRSRLRPRADRKRTAT